MVGDTKVLIPALPGSIGHLLQRRGTVGAVGMAMQDAAEVFVCDQFRKLSRLPQLNFTATFAKLGRDERQSEGAIDVLLFSRRNDAPALAEAAGSELHSFFFSESLEFGDVR